MGRTCEAVIELRQVRKVFRDFWLRPRVTAVSGLDLSVERGEAVGLLGPNGSGKSTTIKMLVGLLYPSSGRIAVFGHRPGDLAVQRRIGYLPEETQLYPFLTAAETLDFYGCLFHLSRDERRRRSAMLLEMLGLSGAQYRPIGEYSRGMQRRVGLAQALINDPDLLILDEPTSGMDPIAARQIKQLLLELRNRGKSIILCTHLLGEIEDVCSRLLILYGGRIRAAGAAEELLAIENRQQIEVDPLRPATLAKINELLLAEEGKGIRSVGRPRQRLETLFLQVVREAERQGVGTSGATSGGTTAAFLTTAPAEGAALLHQLVAAPMHPAPPPAEPDLRPTIDDALLIDEVAEATTPPGTREGTGERDRVPATAPPPPEEPDRDLLELLRHKP